MYDYGARWYDSTIGRFISADTIVPGAGDPQALNRYSYTLNNPLKYTDPTGHFWWIAAGAAVGAAVAYGAQVAGNLDQGIDLGAALTTNIDGTAIVAGALIGATTVAMAPVAVAMAGEALMGAGLLAGGGIGTGLFSAGLGVSGVAGSMAAAVYGVPKVANAGAAPTTGDNSPQPRNNSAVAGRGSTADPTKGTTAPRNLREQLAIEQAIADPVAGQQIKLLMSDPRWPASQGWTKLQQVVKPGGERINMHYLLNRLTGENDDFKIIIPGPRPQAK